MSEKWGPDDLSEEERSNPEFQPGRHEAVLRLLLERGADVGAMTDAGQTVLHIAAASGDVTTIEIILERMPHVDVSVQNEHGRTSLGSAFMGKHETALRVLLTSAKLETADFGSDEQRRDALSWTSVNPVRHDIAKLIMAKMPKNTEEPILVESDVWSAIEWATFMKLPQVLWMLLASSPRSEETREILERAMRLATRQDQSYLPTKEGMRPSHEKVSADEKGGNDELKEAGSTDAGKHGQSDYEQAVMDILREPPTGLLYSDVAGHPQPKKGLKEILATCSKFL